MNVVNMDAYSATIEKAMRESLLADAVKKLRALAAEIEEKKEQVPEIEQWAIHGASAAMESAVFSKNEIEARNIAALIFLAFNLERSHGI